ncbi:uncharacterized protein isoform X2 [Danio rerio]
MLKQTVSGRRPACSPCQTGALCWRSWRTALLLAHTPSPDAADETSPPLRRGARCWGARVSPCSGFQRRTASANACPDAAYPGSSQQPFLREREQREEEEKMHSQSHKAPPDRRISKRTQSPLEPDVWPQREMEAPKVTHIRSAAADSADRGGVTHFTCDINILRDKSGGCVLVRIWTMDLLLLVFLLLCSIHQTFTSVLGRNSRNLFTERVCCKRQSHVIYIGKDISGSPVNVDVGVCRTHCGQSAHFVALEAGLRASKYSSMLDFLRHKKIRHLDPSSSEVIIGSPSCGLSSSCEPAGVRVEPVMLYEGLREIEIIQDCHCEAKISQCVRAPALKTYHSNTPYETVIDVGKCVGSKGAPEGFSCVPTKFDSTFIQTPNKVELIQTVAQCKLIEGCYRMPLMEYHYETTYSDDGVQIESLKEIDVGRCLGSCTSGSRCLLRSVSDLGECLLWAEGQGKVCVPQSFESHTILTQNGQIYTVDAITSCVCQS